MNRQTEMQRDMRYAKAFFHPDKITIRLYAKTLLQGTTWRIHRQVQWAVLGANGSGKSALVKALAGKLPVIAGTIRRQHHVLLCPPATAV
jgi:ABC-type molybdenum transport system ATPase subunit/photorepair protein PhrA